MRHQKSLFGISVCNISIEKYADDKNVIVKIVRKNKVLGQKHFASYEEYLNWIDNIHDDFGRGNYCHYQDAALIKRACDDITSEKWFE